MHEAILKLECKNPEIVMKSLEHDIKNSLESNITITKDKKSVIISIKSEKLNHIKAIINSYLSIVAALKEVEELK
jgi:tRNA threonylcarbamoyladenosine modification (KEOPS) complex  Pcc1 subunit